MNTSKENQYRKYALNLVQKIKEARYYLNIHKPSLGAYGEFLLMETLSLILPDNLKVSQGFVVDYTGEKWESPQCDIIIHHKDWGIVQTFGNVKLIDVKSVCAIVEVKSSIIEKTFHTTLKTFEKLASKGVKNTFIFVYGRLTKRSLSSWLFSYNGIVVDTNTLISETTKFDWSDIEWLPKGIASLHNNTFYGLSHIQTVNGDYMGYLAYNKMIIRKSTQISAHYQ